MLNKSDGIMVNQTQEITVVPYNPQWSNQFEEDAALIKKCLGPHCLEIHHIGSTAIPGLCAKPILDILCVVDSLSSSLMLQDIGFTFKGEMNIPLRNYFTKSSSPMKINLHVVEPHHGFSELNLCFRDYLRAHDDVRMAYGRLKEELLSDPVSQQRASGGFPIYTLRKDQFIKDILQQAGYEGMTLNFCLHDTEWKAYNRIAKANISQEQVTDYHDPNNKQFYFVLYKGIKIVGVAFVEVISEKKAAIKFLGTDVGVEKARHESYLKEALKNWMVHHGYSL
jgi:GrpB-like predicted nucleotidyltransferase (UPF0157 family)